MGSELKTYGDLKKLINYIKTSQKGGKLLSKGKEIAVDQILGLIPGASNVKTALGFFKAAFEKPDTVKTNTWLDKLDIDDEISKIVDDTVENSFLEFLSKSLENTPDDKELEDDFNINKNLQTYLKDKFKNRSVMVPESDDYNNKNNMSKLNEDIGGDRTYTISTWYNKKITDVKTFDNIKDARDYVETLDAELVPFKMLPKKKYYDFRSMRTNIKSEQYIYNKKENMSKLNKLIKENINNLLEGSEMFDDMTVAFGVKHKSNNLSDAEKNQFGPMGQLKNDKGGSFQNPGFPGKAITDNSKKESGKEAQDYYKEVLKKVMDYQNPNDKEEFDAPKTPTNTSDVETENERLKLTGYDTGVSGMEVVMDKSTESGGSEMSKKKYKERMDKIQGDKMNYDYMKKSARKTNDLKYKKDAQNGRPVKAQKSKQPETAEVKESYEGVNSKNIFKVKGTITSENQIMKLVEKLPSRVKIDETVFVITDGENTYKLIWEGEEHNGEATIKNFRNNQMVNEDIQKMKHLWDFNTKEKYEFKNNITENGDEAFKRIFKIVKNK
jgi:hypothetical protein